MGLTLIRKSRGRVPERDPRIAVVLAGGAISGGAFEVGGLKALDDFLVDRKITDMDVYVGLSAGAILAASLAAGITPDELVGVLDGSSTRLDQLRPMDIYSPNLSEAVERPLRSAALLHDLHLIERVVLQHVRKDGEGRVFTHVHVHDRFPFELTVYAANKAHYVFKSSVTGKAMERVSIAELEQFLAEAYPRCDLEQAVLEAENRIDRFQIFEMLLWPLEKVQQSRKYHPEGDALYHSLQVFDLARDQLPYDEEFLLAALLHDVGKAIDPRDHVAAAVEALDGFITARTAWLITHHMEGHALRARTIGARARRRMEASENFDDLLLLSECDERGREPGVQVPDVDEALEYVRELSQMYGT